MRPALVLAVAALACGGCAPQLYRRNAVVVEVVDTRPSQHGEHTVHSEWPGTLQAISSIAYALVNRGCKLCQLIGLLRDSQLVGGSVASDVVKQAGNADIRAHRITIPLPDDDGGGGPRAYRVETDHRPDGSVRTTVEPLPPAP